MRYHIRRQDKEIKDPEKLKKILLETDYVTLALVKDGEPYLVSLSHAYDEEENCIYFHSASEGKKLDYMRASPVVWGQALLDHGYHKGQCSHLYASVMFKGKIEFIEDLETKRHVFRAMVNQIEPEPESIMDRMINSEGIPSTAVGRIRIDYMSGKKSAEVSL
ncbi:MAG: pyridoxamine 5'-phosphate oxidase family protein [Candidatus Bathyarchaeota archaeon]|nr:pyridoxamine 5'-phosphate oxidase family protein [Candidatus Bathyarchaeota archaeon]